MAGVLTLEVQGEARRGKAVAGEVAVPQAGGPQVTLEASLGDMMTME